MFTYWAAWAEKILDVEVPVNTTLAFAAALIVMGFPAVPLFKPYGTEL